MLTQQYHPNVEIATTLTATQSTMLLKNNQPIYCTMAGSHSYGMITDGVAIEWVKVTGCIGLLLSIERAQFGTVARTWVAGMACFTASQYHPLIVCEMVSQGGCDVTTNCPPLSTGEAIINEMVEGKDWLAFISFNNALDVEAINVPAWATATVIGQTIKLSGLVPIAQTDFDLVVRATGCNSQISLYKERVKVCKQLGVSL
jgi:hypothetical protein